MTKKEKFTKLQTIKPKYFDHKKNEWIGTLTRDEAIKELNELLKSFDIYENKRDAELTYALDEARQTNNINNRYVKHGKQYFLIYQDRISSNAELSGRDQEFIKIA